MICIYAETARSYTGNGLGALTPKAAQVKEAVNGSYELTLTHPLDGAGRWRALEEGRVVRAPAPSRECPAIEISGGDARTVWRVKPTLPQNWKRANVYSRKNASNSFIISQWRCGAEFALLEQSGSWLRATGPDGVTGYVIREYCEYVRQEPAQESTVIPARRARDQLFRIYDTALDTRAGEMAVKARHIFYDLLDCIAVSCDCKGMTVQQALDALSAASTVEHSFHFYTDDTETVIDRDYSLKSIAAAILDPDEGLLHDAGLYLVRDNYDVYLLKAPGKRRPGIRYGRELQGVQLNVNRDKTCNRIIPVGKTKDGKPLLIDGGWVDSPRLTENDRVVTRVIEYDVQVGDKMTAAQAKAKLRELALGEFDRGIDGVDVTLDVRFLFLGDTVEYQQYRELDRVYLYDSVPVTDTLHGVAAETMMTECTYDCLTGRYVGAHFGMTGEQATIGAVQGYELAAGSVTGVKVLRGSLGGYQLQDGAISTPKLQAGAVTADIIAAGAVIAEAIAAGAITAAKIDAGAVNADKIAADAVTAAKIAAGAVTADKIDAGAVTAEKIAAHAITAAQIAAGTITANEIAANAVDAYAVAAVKAEIRRLVAGSITADQLYTDLAAIAYAQITTANINRANIDWASIDTLKAGYAHITDGAIDNADIGFARIKDLVSGTAIITEGVGGKLYISRLAVDGAQIVELLVNQLYIKNSEGQLQQLTVDAATGKVMGGALLADRSVDAGDILIEHSITASELNVSQIFADQALVGAIKAANIDVANLFASTATVNQLTTWLTKAQTIEALEGSLQLWASDMIDLRVSKVRVGGRNLLRKSQKLTTAAGTGETSADVWRLAGSTAYVYDGDPFNRARLALTGGTEEWGTVIGSPLAKLGDNWRGRQVTFSCWVWSNNWAAIDKGITVSLNLSTGGVARLNYGSKYNIVVPGSVQWGADAGYEQTLANRTWRRFWTTFTLDETTLNGGSGTFADNTHMFVQLWLRQNGEVRMYGPQLEWGNIPSDWTPAEEDIDDRVSKTETSLSVLDGEIAAKVDTETFNGLENRVEAAELKITDSAIVSTVRSSTAYTNDLAAKADQSALTSGLSGKNKVFTAQPTPPYIVGDLWVQGSGGGILRCKTARASGSYTAGDWEAASNYTDLGTAQSWVQNNYSTTTQTNERINSTVTTEIGKIRVGGANLLRHSKELTTGSAADTWRLGNNASTYSGSPFWRGMVAVSGSSSEWQAVINSPLVRLGDDWKTRQVTFSCYVSSANWAAVDKGIVITMNLSQGGTTRLNYGSKYSIVVPGSAAWGTDAHYDKPLTNNAWRRFWVTFSLDENDLPNGDGTFNSNTHMWIAFWLRQNGDVRFYAPQLEWGNTPGDWTPAKEDLDDEYYTAMSEINQKADSIQASVKELYVGGTQLLTGTDVLEIGSAASDWRKVTASNGDVASYGDGRALFIALGLSANAQTGLRSPVVDMGSGWYGRKVTFSCLLHTTSSGIPDQGIIIGLNLNANGGTAAPRYRHYYNVLKPGEAEWGADGQHEGNPSDYQYHRVSVTWELTDAVITQGSGTLTDMTHMYVNITLRRNGWLYVKDMKLEWGDHATDWSPHPKEFRNSAVTIDLDGIKLETAENGKIVAVVGDDEQMVIDKDGVRAPIIKAEDRVEAPNLVECSTSATASSQTITTGIQTAIDALPKYLTKDVTLLIPNGTYTENVVIAGFHGGGTLTLRPASSSPVLLKGNITVRDCYRVAITGYNNTRNTFAIQPQTARAIIDAIGVGFLDLQYLNLLGYAGRTTSSNGSTYGLQTVACHARVVGCLVERTSAGLAFRLASTAYISACLGGASGNAPASAANLSRGVAAYEGSHIGVTGTIPMAYTSGAYADGTSTLKGGSGAQTASDGSTPTPTTNVASVACSQHKTFIYGSNPTTGTKVSQGRYGAYSTGQTGWREGVMWFGGLTALAGKTISKAVLRLRRAQGGNGGSATVNVYAVSLATSTSTTSLTPPTGSKVSANMAIETDVDIDVTSLVQNATLNNDFALALYETPEEYVTGWSYGYAQIYGANGEHPPVLTVTYT